MAHICHENPACGKVNGHTEVNNDLLAAAQHFTPGSLEKYRGMRCFPTTSRKYVVTPPSDIKEDIWPVCSVCLPFVEPDDRRLRKVSGILPPARVELISSTMQGPLRAVVLQGRPEGSDDEVRQRPSSVAQPEHVGAAGGYSQESRYEGAQTQMR